MTEYPPKRLPGRQIAFEVRSTSVMSIPVWAVAIVSETTSVACGTRPVTRAVVVDEHAARS